LSKNLTRYCIIVRFSKRVPNPSGNYYDKRTEMLGVSQKKVVFIKVIFTLINRRTKIVYYTNLCGKKHNSLTNQSEMIN
jgi:hypothetical protein